MPIRKLEPTPLEFVPASTTGAKFDAGKPRWDLLPWDEVGQVVEVLTHGAVKYAPDNWKHVEDGRDRYFAALLRHIHAHRMGDVLDPESGLTHLAHAACNLLFLMHFEQQEPLGGSAISPTFRKSEAP